MDNSLFKYAQSTPKNQLAMTHQNSYSSTVNPLTAFDNTAESFAHGIYNAPGNLVDLVQDLGEYSMGIDRPTQKARTGLDEILGTNYLNNEFVPQSGYQKAISMGGELVADPAMLLSPLAYGKAVVTGLKNNQIAENALHRAMPHLRKGVVDDSAGLPMDEDLSALSINKLKRSLSQLEQVDMEKARKRGDWAEFERLEKEEISPIRKELFNRTGDPYGRIKRKKTTPSDELLNEGYAHPDDVPQEVIDYLNTQSPLTQDATDAVRWSRIKQTQNEERLPNELIDIYRAVDGDEIRPGDWVTTDPNYAQMHLERYLNNNGQIVSDRVNGRDILASPTGNYEEAIYAPWDLSYSKLLPLPAGLLGLSTLEDNEYY